MTNLRSLLIVLGSLAFVASLGAACGHDELLLGQASGSGGENTGGVASKAGGPDASTGGGPAGGGTTSSGGGPNDAAGDGLAGSAGALADASSDVIEDAADGSDAPAAVVPDFHLVDENPASATYKQLVSPRDYLGQVSAWYFGHAT